MTISGTITLKKGREHSIQRFHPWIFSGAIQAKVGKLTDGCWVEVKSVQNKTLGYGHYQEGSISVRVLLFGTQMPTDDFWYDKIKQASTLRQQVSLPESGTNAFRLIHGEGDGLSGLIIDYYHGVAIIQAHDAGMHLDRTFIATALQKVLGNQLRSIYYKSQGTLPGQLRDALCDEYLYGKVDVPIVVEENHKKFLVDWEGGQKTGFFLDQRDNRKLLGEYSKGKKVLNTFCYTGGFTIYALHAGATLVHSVDASEKAIELTRKNILLNGFDPNVHECFAADTFDFLKEEKADYDVVILDPPAFAKHRDARHQAVKGYQRLNAETIRRMKPGGIIFTFSCSQVVDRQLFYDTLVSASIQAGRQIKVLHHLSQPADHPVSMFHPEGEYLKGLVLYIE